MSQILFFFHLRYSLVTSSGFFRRDDVASWFIWLVTLGRKIWRVVYIGSRASKLAFYRKIRFISFGTSTLWQHFCSCYCCHARGCSATPHSFPLIFVRYTWRITLFVTSRFNFLMAFWNDAVAFANPNEKPRRISRRATRRKLETFPLRVTFSLWKLHSAFEDYI